MRMRLTAQLETAYHPAKPPDLAIQCRSSYKHSAEEEVKPAGKSSMGIDPLEPVHNLYGAEFKERFGELNSCDRDVQVRNKNFFFVQQFDMSIVNDAA